VRSTMKKCLACGVYTLKDACPSCGRPTGSPMPPRYSPEDRYGAYRRKLKRVQRLET
jgi:H/ACA ribonucleoprotein complex subunit 3